MTELYIRERNRPNWHWHPNCHWFKLYTQRETCLTCNGKGCARCEQGTRNIYKLLVIDIKPKANCCSVCVKLEKFEIARLERKRV